MSSTDVSLILNHAPTLLIAVGGGSALGALARYAVTTVLSRSIGALGGTWVVNVTGAAMLGVWVGWLSVSDVSDLLAIGVSLGFLGSYTTVSSFALQAWPLFAVGQRRTLVVYVLGSALGCLAAFAVGWWMVSQLAVGAAEASPMLQGWS